MPNCCAVCGKTVAHGHRVSHAENKSNRVWLPNIQKVRVKVGGGARRLSVCTRCLKSGRVVRAV
ncbi:MAG: 50S ribosomal protein L28 [Bacillota bacterium]